MADEISGRSRALFSAAMLGLGLTFFYVLSSVPFCWLLIKTKNFDGLVPSGFFDAYAGPVGWLADHNKLFANFMVEYCKLFGLHF